MNKILIILSAVIFIMFISSIGYNIIINNSYDDIIQKASYALQSEQEQLKDKSQKQKPKTISQKPQTFTKSINWFSAIAGIAGALFGIYIWFYDRKNKKKSTLYYPLFLACNGIDDVIKKYENLGETRCRSLFDSCAKILDEIVYNYGSIIYLRNVEDIRTFLSMKKDIDEKLELFKQHNWIALKEMFRRNEFKEIESYTRVLLLRCSKEIKSLRKLSE